MILLSLRYVKVALTALSFLGVFIGEGRSQHNEYIEGVHFFQVSSSASKLKLMPDLVVFLDFESPFCFRVLPELRDFRRKMPASSHFSIYPISASHLHSQASSSHQIYSTVYIVSQILGKDEFVLEALFDYIHVKRLSLRSQGDAIRFLEGLGFNADRVKKLISSYKVDAELKKIRSIYHLTGLRQVPSFFVQGQYVVGPGRWSSFQSMLDVVNFVRRLPTHKSAK